jgi:hypothetical protein
METCPTAMVAFVAHRPYGPVKEEKGSTRARRDVVAWGGVVTSPLRPACGGVTHAVTPGFRGRT